jgi:hypothetical protein
MFLIEKGKAILVTVRGGSQGCETSRFPHFLDNRLADGGEVVSLTRRPLFTSRNIPGTHLLQAEISMASSEIAPATFRFVA